MMVRVEAPTFVAGLIIGADDICSLADQEHLGWAVGKSSDELRAHFRDRSWKATVILPHKEKGP